MEVLSTAFALCCALAAGFFAWRTGRDTDDVHDAVRDLAQVSARIATLEVEHEGLKRQHLKLRGAFYATRPGSGPPASRRPLDEFDEPEPRADTLTQDFVDDELAATLALQTAPPVRPGSNGSG